MRYPSCDQKSSSIDSFEWYRRPLLNVSEARRRKSEKLVVKEGVQEARQAEIHEKLAQIDVKRKLNRVRKVIDAVRRAKKEIKPDYQWQGDEKLQKIVAKYGHDRFVNNTRYWFWNLTTSRTLDKLIKQGVLKHRGNGLYRFEKLRT